MGGSCLDRLDLRQASQPLENIAPVTGAALVSLIPRPTAGVRFHNKWVWAALIVLVNWLGPLVYFAVGRLDLPLPDDSGAAGVPAAVRSRTRTHEPISFSGICNW